jgi:hypothetical protein
VNTSNSLVLGNNASVGIGTIAPLNTLDINGTLGAKVKVGQIAGTNHPDHTATIWIYSSSVATISIPSPSSSPNRIYALVNQLNVPIITTPYKPMTPAGTANSIPANSSLWIVSDGSIWMQIK